MDDEAVIAPVEMRNLEVLRLGDVWVEKWVFSSPAKDAVSVEMAVFCWRDNEQESQSLSEELEGVGPLILAEAGDAPEHAERFDGAGGFYASHVGGLPAELVEDIRYRGF